MAANYDAELTQLAAEILRESVQGYDPSDPGQWLPNPVLAAWSTNMFGGLAPTASFAAVTGSFAAVTGSFAAAPGGFAAAGDLAPSPTGAFRALTGAFKAIADPPAPPRVTLKRVFRLPGRLPGVWLVPEPELAAMVGASEPAVHKALRQLRNDKIVMTGYRQVAITDPAALVAIASSRSGSGARKPVK